MDDKNCYARLAGWSGIIFVILSLAIVVMVPPLPALSKSALEVADYYLAYGNKFLLGNYIAMFAAAPSFIFFSYLVKRIKDVDESGWLWISVLTTMIVAHAVGAVDLIFFQAVAYAGSLPDPNSIKIFSDLALIGFGFFFLTQAAFAGYASWAILKTKAFSPIHAWLGVATALTSFLPSLGTVMTKGIWTVGGPVTTCGFLVFFVWVVFLSLSFLRGK